MPQYQPIHVVRSPFETQRFCIPLEQAERLFLLYHLCRVSPTADAVLKNPKGMVGPWSRQQVVDRIRALVSELRLHDRPLFLLGGISFAVIAEGIHGNRYFTDMTPGDPRFNREAVARANALRSKVMRITGRRIGFVPTGRGRKLAHAPRPHLLENFGAPT